jgi:5-methylcytosine-specific restriction endonuclease McrA
MLKSAQTAKIGKSDIVARVSVFGERCAYCGGPFEHLDHVKPISLGGPHILSNLRPSCAKCNLTKNAKPAKEWLANLRPIGH